MTVWRDSLAVADMRGSQVVVLPRSLDGGRSFGRKGEGPSELASPQGVAAAGDRLAVFDRGNGRITWLEPDGRATGSRDRMIPSIPAVSFVALDGDRVLMPAASPDYYAAIDGPTGPREVLRRPDGLEPLDDSPFTSNMVVASTGRTFMVDAENGVVGRVDGSELVDVDSLPPALRESAEATVAEIAAPERRVTPIFAAGPAPDGIVVWLIGKNDPAGAIWTTSGEWIPIRLSPTVFESFPTYPSDVLVWSEELFVLTGEGIRVYRLVPGDGVDGP